MTEPRNSIGSSGLHTPLPAAFMQCLLCAFLTELPTVLAKAHSQRLEPSLWVFAKLSHPERLPKPSLVPDTEDVSSSVPSLSDHSLRASQPAPRCLRTFPLAVFASHHRHRLVLNEAPAPQALR